MKNKITELLVCWKCVIVNLYFETFRLITSKHIIYTDLYLNHKMMLPRQLIKHVKLIIRPYKWKDDQMKHGYQVVFKCEKRFFYVRLWMNFPWVDSHSFNFPRSSYIDCKKEWCFKLSFSSLAILIHIWCISCTMFRLCL